MARSPDETDERAALVRLVRDEGARVLATLVRTTGSLQLAEDAVQDAVMRAAPSLQRVLASAIADGGWFDAAHEQEINGQ